MKTQSQHLEHPSGFSQWEAETIAVHQIVKLSNITWIRHTLNKKMKAT